MKRVLLVAVFALSACSAGITLTDAQQVWCDANWPVVFDTSHAIKDDLGLPLELYADEDSDDVQKQKWNRACVAAYEAR